MKNQFKYTFYIIDYIFISEGEQAYLLLLYIKTKLTVFLRYFDFCQYTVACSPSNVFYNIF